MYKEGGDSVDYHERFKGIDPSVLDNKTLVNTIQELQEVLNLIEKEQGEIDEYLMSVEFRLVAELDYRMAQQVEYEITLKLKEKNDRRMMKRGDYYKN